MIKCIDWNEAMDTFAEALSEVSVTSGSYKKLRILYKTVLGIRDSINPEDLPKFLEEANAYVEYFADIKDIAQGFEKALNPDFSFQSWDDRMSQVDGEETDEAKINRRAKVKKDFLVARFKDPTSQSSAGRAMLYFMREAKLNLMSTFMVDRDNGRLVSEQEIPQNVREAKQKLIDTIVTYLKEVQGYSDLQLGDTTLFDDEGNFWDILGEGEPLRRAIDDHLQIGNSFTTDNLKDAYERFRSEKGDNWWKDKLFIDAYNAKILLEDYDQIITMFIGNIVHPGSREYNKLSNESYHTKISRATNMWSNGYGDEVKDISDLVSDITQMLIQTSKKYSWKSPIPMQDLYLSFLDFNYILTKIKKLVKNPVSRGIVLNNKFFDHAGNSWDNISNNTKRTINTLRDLRRKQGLSEDPTFEDVLAFISDNPQRHLHSIFDLLCNTNLIEHYHGLNTNDKNLIWTVGKEIFGSWKDEIDEEGNIIPSRSLFDMHRNSNQDKIFEIVTQIADSMFADEYIQYYEDQEGTLKMRFLQDYAVSQIKNNLLARMKQTNGLLDEARFLRFIDTFGITVDKVSPTKIFPGTDDKNAWLEFNSGEQAKYLRAEFIQGINIPIGDKLIIQYNQGKLIDFTPANKNLFTNDYESVWKSNEFRKFVKEAIGIDFNTDVELASAYEETFKVKDNDKIIVDYSALVKDLSKICGSAVFNQYFNNVTVPTLLRKSKKDRYSYNIELLRELQFAGQSVPKINSSNGTVEMIAEANKEAYLHHLGTAQATVSGLLTAAQVKTGESTALASYCLSCLRSSYPYQIMVLNRNRNSSTNHTTFVKNENGLFQDVVKVREFKSDASVKTNTSMSSAELFTASFLGGWVGAFCPDHDSSTINRGGNAYITPAVYSDKVVQDQIRLQLDTESRWQPGKKYINMTDAELELDMNYEFGTMYDNIVKEINKENEKILSLLGLNDIQEMHPITKYRTLLLMISGLLCTSNDVVTLLQLKYTGKGIGEDIAILQEKGLLPDEILNALYGDPEYIKSLENCISHNKNSSNPRIIEGCLRLEKILEHYSDNKKAIASIRKNRITEQLHEVTKKYNLEHRRNPIEICEHVHYLFGKDGNLVPNDTLIALWGRFQGTSKINELLGITKLYPQYHESASTVEGYFRDEKDIRLVQELLQDGVEIFLLGSHAKKNQPEIEYLLNNFPDWRTDSYKMAFAKVFVPNYAYRVGDKFTSFQGATTEVTKCYILNGTRMYNLRSVSASGNVTERSVSEEQLRNLQAEQTEIASFTRGPIDETQGHWKITQDANEIKTYAENPSTRDMIKIHPMLSKLNRMSYLAAQQYTSSVGGAHYVYKGGGANVLEEEASRWLASNKRNVCYPSTVHKFQNKTLTGVPKYYQIAPIEDIKSTIYSIMGDLDSHKPIDGGMYVNPWFTVLENNSLAGEAAGLDKKQFGTYYYERYAAGGIIKTAGFAITNQRMRNSEAYRNLAKNCTDRKWIKEFTNADGYDIEETLDITRDYKGQLLNWIEDDRGHGTYYLRETEDGRLGRFKLAKIEAIYTNGIEERVLEEGENRLGWEPTNRYKIYEYPVTARGQIDTNHPAIAELLTDKALDDVTPIQRTFGANENGEFEINTNWKFFNYIFGGYRALSINTDGILEESENSIYQMVHAINNIGYERIIDNNDYRFGENQYTDEFFDSIDTQDELWQPLKYSDISYAPNIGALKSTLMNVNPKEAMYEDTPLNAMNVMMAQLGIQLDKEHHADNSEVSMPTQIIQACANKGYTINYTSQLYKSLSTLTEIAIADCMDGIMEIMPGHENKGKLLAEVANIIVSKLIRSKDDNSALDAAMGFIIERAKDGHKLTPDEVVGKTPWSDPAVYQKIYNDLASHFTSNAIKMKFNGTLAVICPTERMEQMYGDRRLSSFADPDGEYKGIRGITETLGLEIYQNKIRNSENPKELIYQLETDALGNDIMSNEDRLNAASNLDTQHHYWIEWADEDGMPITTINENGDEVLFRENVTINTPADYNRLKEWLAYGGNDGYIEVDGLKISRKGMKVTRMYENVTKGRELSAYNARFEATNNETGDVNRFNIFDIDSIRRMFDFNDIAKNLSNALDLLEEENFIEPLIALANDLIVRHIKKYNLEAYKAIAAFTDDRANINWEKVISDNATEANKLEKAFTDAAFKVCKVLTYKAMEKDLFKISKDYEGDRQLYVNGYLVTVDPDTIETQAYELIMPKVYQTIFGLQKGDLVQEILADEDFFTKRAINKVKKQHVSEDCFHYELKNYNGKHIYIFDSRKGPVPDVLVEKHIEPYEESPGKWVRNTVDGDFMYSLSSVEDKVMEVGKLGYEVIVTDNPEHYFENLDFNLAAFSNTTVGQDQLLELVNNLKNSNKGSIKKFLRNITNKQGNLRNFNVLKRRNEAFKNLTLEPDPDEPWEILNLISQFVQEGKELHASFNKSLDVIAGRIPAQSQQSFMPQRVVAFDNNDINTAYVSTFQLFLLGSDLDPLCIQIAYKSRELRETS